jgi:hypothetical protein
MDSPPRRGQAGRDALAIRERHAGLRDEKVLALAISEGRWIATFDPDHGELVFRKNCTRLRVQAQGACGGVRC